MQTNGKPLQAFSYDEFMALDFAVKYTIDPLLSQGGIGLLHGKGGHGKTQLAFTVMREMLRGGNLFGRYNVRAGAILYFQFDMPEQLFQERLGRLNDNLSHTERITLVSRHHAINLFDRDTREEIEDIIAAAEPSLIVWDTLRKLHPYDENDNAVPSQLYSIVSDISGNASSLILHHDRKSSALQPGENDDNARESFRGARAWVDDCDLGMRVRKRKSRNEIALDWSKLRCAEQPTLLLRMNPETLLLEGRVPQSAREWAVQILGEQPKIDRADLVREIMERAGVAKTVAYDAINNGL